jgi:AraC family transcriptional regulator
MPVITPAIPSALTPAERAVWYVEAHLAGDLTLAAVAGFVGVTPQHLARLFVQSTGVTVMRYARARRMTQAARALADGAPDILAVALDWGYSSHEAFTRAFREVFGVTPEAVRGRGLQSLPLQDPLIMDSSLLVDVAPPRFAAAPARLVAGLRARYTFATNHGIPAQWMAFIPWCDGLADTIGTATYGVCHDYRDGSFDYLAGIEVARADTLPRELDTVRLEAGDYAVFEHRGHISGFRKTVYTIWNRLVPDLRLTLADAPNFELYDERFDGRTGNGLVEIWLPLA